MRFEAILVALAVLAPASASAADQFDLICRGDQSDGRGGPKSPVEIRYRIDLAAGRWCIDACAAASSITQVTPDRIYIERDDVAIRRGVAPNFYHFIERTSGAYTFFVAGSADRHATCSPAPFSGMPAPKF